MSNTDLTNDTNERAAIHTLIWEQDPIKFALDAPSLGDDNRPLCVQLGHRLLRAQLEFSEWVLRRVEKVTFASDRRVSRTTSIEFEVPEYAPVLQAEDGTQHWLVPLTVMRRRTLVNLDMRDENGQTLGMLGMRLTQKLDEALLRAAASKVPAPQPGPGRAGGKEPETIDQFIARAISGKWQDVSEAKQEFDAWKESKKAVHAAYFENAAFGSVIERLWHNFTLYVTLPVDLGRHRVLRLSFEEKVVWRYQRPLLVPTKDGAVEYEPMHEHVRMTGAWRENLGLWATRIRFLTPSAELCASYHFEFIAPTSLGIVRAALLAGQPNEQRGKPGSRVLAWDEAENPGQAVGLHVVGVPRGSLCRAQVDLRIPSRGWLTTVLASCAAIAIVLASVVWHMLTIGDDAQWSVEQVTNIVLLLVTVSAGTATYVAQHHANEVAARLVSGLRGFGAVALTVPALAAMLLVYLRDDLDKGSSVPWVLWPGMIGLLALSLFVTFVVGAAWVKTWRMERRDGRPSPCDMTNVVPASDTSEPRKPRVVTEDHFAKAAKELGFSSPAVGVASAEGWREIYAWSGEESSGAEEQSLDHPSECTCTVRFDHSKLSWGLPARRSHRGA